MNRKLIVKTFFGLLCLLVIAAANNSVAAQRKGYENAATLPTAAENARSARAHAAWLRRNKSIWAERERRRLAAERRSYEARKREYARRKSIADAVNKRNRSYAVRKARPSTKRRSTYVYQPSNRREIQVTAIPVQPN